MQIDFDLLKKYNVAVPRYTSYPTVPFWDAHIEPERWMTLFKQQFRENNPKEGISLYIHLPFCEALCTYCGCNKKITTNHAVEYRYLEAVKKEWQLYLEVMEEKPILREVHLGGGTPTFFSPENLADLLNTIFKGAIIHPNHEFGFEGHPNNTTREHLQVLYRLGFRRVSYGVQDLDPEVQRIINRIQPFENVQSVTEMARAIGFDSVNFDLIYGLPRQTPQRIEKTILQSIGLRPDRVAYYSYAHVPWTSKGQRLFDERDLPTADQKITLNQIGRKLFTQNDYQNIGMDHFALTTDRLSSAANEGKLFRNFMGYTTQKAQLLLGLGVSSISDLGMGFSQNHKTLREYYRCVDAGLFPVSKGYFLNEQDRAFRQYILDIACQSMTTFKRTDFPVLEQVSFPVLATLAADNLIKFNQDGIIVTELGRYFLRNICSAFDLHLLKASNIKLKNDTYSKAF